MSSHPSVEELKTKCTPSETDIYQYIINTITENFMTELKKAINVLLKHNELNGFKDFKDFISKDAFFKQLTDVDKLKQLLKIDLLIHYTSKDIVSNKVELKYLLTLLKMTDLSEDTATILENEIIQEC